MDEKKVPRRKKHRNLRLGCATCKRRRVKCQENLPACTNCVKHKVECDYLHYLPLRLEEFRGAKRAQALEQAAGGLALLALGDRTRKAQVTTDFDDFGQPDNPIIYPVYSVVAPLRDSPQPPGAALPHARRGRFVFPLTPLPHFDHEQAMVGAIAQYGPGIFAGSALLPEIRQVYHRWIGFFIARSWRLSILFSCLLNLTTNFLITTVVQPRGPAMERALELLVVLSIKHYARVIKGLRLYLHQDLNPEMAALISYILLLMAIYDPEATPHTTKCFRDGMFSVLSYAQRQAEKRGVPPPLLVPVHLRLMTNVVLTVYLPPYCADFLGEYQTMLAQLGEVMAAARCEGQLVQTHAALVHLAQQCIDRIIPAVNARLDDIEFQENTFFTLFRAWGTLMVGPLVQLKRTALPLEKLVSLFFRLFRKALYAVTPQMRFFYLRDLDLPLLLDVFDERANAVYAELALPPLELAKWAPQLRTLALYAIRTSTFFTIRLLLLYRNLLFHERHRVLIDNVVEWRSSIVDIRATRTAFIERAGLTEVPIRSFADTYIGDCHYPDVPAPDTPARRLLVPPKARVDYLLLQQHGLLARDQLP